MPIWMVLAKSSSRTGALSRMPYRLTPIKAFMQHNSVCTRSSSKRNNCTCSIGCLASARCIACNVGICGSLSSRFTSRLPRLSTWVWKPIVTVILRNKNQQHEKRPLWLVFNFYLDLIWVLFSMICYYLRITLSWFCLIWVLFCCIWSYLVVFGRIQVLFGLIWILFGLIWDLFGSY